MLKNALRWIYAQLVYCPAFLILRGLQLIGIEVAVYPDLFGHQAFDVEHRLRLDSAKPRWRKIYLRDSAPPNQFLLELHSKQAWVLKIPKFVFRWLRQARKIDNKRGKLLGKPPIFYKRGFEEKLSDFDTWNNMASRLTFSPAEHERGREILARLGLEAGQYVCFHARDSHFALSHYPEMWHRVGTGKDTSTLHNAAAYVGEFEHGFFQTYRNSDFSDYTLALEWLATQGMRGVRVGSADQNIEGVAPNLVDFGGRWRHELDDESDFADIYIMSHCRFYVGTATGVTVFALSANRPLLWVNSFPWPWAHSPPLANSLYMPKLWYLHGEREPASFGEMLDFSRNNDWRKLYDDEFVRSLDLTVRDNSPDEILNAVKEMDARLNGSWTDRAEDMERQRQLNAMLDSELPLFGCPARMASDFLENHRSLLGA
jgi:putative glycosyltransferase (TIGR04372 family)